MKRAFLYGVHWPHRSDPQYTIILEDKNSRFDNGRLMDAVRFAWCFGAFLVSYIALAEAGKYAVPSIVPWIAVEVTAGLVQFTLIGLLCGLAHTTKPGG